MMMMMAMMVMKIILPPFHCHGTGGCDNYDDFNADDDGLCDHGLFRGAP